MVPELEIADLRRRLAEHRALLRQLFELRRRLVNKAARGHEEHAERALRIYEDTVTAVRRAMRLAQLRLADLELIQAGRREEIESKGENAAELNGGIVSHRLPPRRRPPPRLAGKWGPHRYRGTNDR